MTDPARQQKNKAQRIWRAEREERFRRTCALRCGAGARTTEGTPKRAVQHMLHAAEVHTGAGQLPPKQERDSRQGPPAASGEHRQHNQYPDHCNSTPYSRPLAHNILFASHFLSTATQPLRWGGTEPSECLGARNLASWATIVFRLWMAQQPEAGSTGPGIAFRRMDFRRDIRSRWRCSASSQC